VWRAARFYQVAGRRLDSFSSVLQKQAKAIKCVVHQQAGEILFYIRIFSPASLCARAPMLRVFSARTTPTTRREKRGESSEREKSLSDLSMDEKTAGEEKHRQGHTRERRAVEPD
jgi:hypothetical protein